MLQKIDKKQLIKELMRLKNERKTLLVLYTSCDHVEFTNTIIIDYMIIVDNNEMKIKIQYQYYDEEIQDFTCCSDDWSFDYFFWDEDLESLVYFEDMDEQKEYQLEIIDFYNKIK